MALAEQANRRVGRYVIHAPIAAGGMATVYFGRLLGPVGFSRTVAIKSLHAQHAMDPEFVAMFLDEARVAARIRHPNVVPTLDVVASAGELFLVLEYVAGESLSRLMAKCFENKQSIPLTIISAVLCNALVGLHAAHCATDERGTLLDIVHRDVSPQNIMVGTDGSARVLDFGIAKAEGRVQQTAAGTVKGKYAYMAPEQLRGGAITPAADIFGIGVILWEMLAGHRRYGASAEMEIVRQLLEGTPPFPHDEPSSRSQDELGSEVFRGLEAIAVKAMGRRASERFATAKDMADAIEACVTPGSVSQVARWVEALAAEKLSERAALLAQIETSDASKADLAHSGIDLLARVKEESHVGELQLEGSSGVMRAAGPPPTDASGSGMMAHPPPNTKALTVGMIALFICFAALVVFTLRNRDGAPVSDARAGGNIVVNAPATVAIPAATSAVSVAPTQTPVASAVASAPSAKVEARAAAPTPRWQGARAATPAAPTTVASPSKATKPDCDPPWTLGPDGTKHFRVECMQ